MPPAAIGIPGTLFLYRDRVRIVAGRFEATHPRLCAPGATSTLPEHRAQQVAAVSSTRAKRYLQREHLLALGPVALAYLTELTHRRPRIWLQDVDRLHGLLATYGEAALRAAFVRALADQAIGAEYVTHFVTEQATPRMPIAGGSTGPHDARSSLLEPLVPSSVGSDRLPFDGDADGGRS
jgi:hypothetical protein